MALGRKADWAMADLRAANESIQRTLAEFDQRFGEYANTVEKIVSDMIGLMKDGHDIDVSGLIEEFRRDEVEARRNHGPEKEAQVGAIFRRLAKTRPEALRIANDALLMLRERADWEAKLYHSARWRLMEARALYQPSVGHGHIHGTGTDLDEYLKTLV